MHNISGRTGKKWNKLHTTLEETGMAIVVYVAAIIMCYITIGITIFDFGVGFVETLSMLRTTVRLENDEVDGAIDFIVHHIQGLRAAILTLSINNTTPSKPSDGGDAISGAEDWTSDSHGDLIKMLIVPLDDLSNEARYLLKTLSVVPKLEVSRCVIM
jgi:hypothetical protein